MSAEEVALVPCDVVTVTSTVAALPFGDFATIWVDETNVDEVAAVVPNFTVALDVKPVPVIVTDVPPAVGPAVGLSPVTVGPVV